MELAAAPVEQSPSNWFAEQVIDSLQDGILPFTRRLELLGAAEDLGIRRFQANLIIAAVQHQHGENRKPDQPIGRFPLIPLLAFIAVQSLILAGIWAVFLR